MANHMLYEFDHGDLPHVVGELARVLDRNGTLLATTYSDAHPVPMTDLFGVAGNALLDGVALDDMYLVRVESLRDLVALYSREIAMLDRRIHARLAGHAGYEAIQAGPYIPWRRGRQFDFRSGVVRLVTRRKYFARRRFRRLTRSDRRLGGFARLYRRGWLFGGLFSCGGRRRR